MLIPVCIDRAIKQPQAHEYPVCSSVWVSGALLHHQFWPGGFDGAIASASIW